MFYLILHFLSWKNNVLSCAWVSWKPPQNTKKNEGPAFVLNDSNSIFLYGVEVTKLSSTITNCFHCPHVGVLRDWNGFKEQECTVQPSALNKKTTAERIPTRSMCTQWSGNTNKTGAGWKACRDPGEESQDSVFRVCSLDYNRTWMTDSRHSTRSLFIKTY